MAAMPILSRTAPGTRAGPDRNLQRIYRRGRTRARHQARSLPAARATVGGRRRACDRERHAQDCCMRVARRGGMLCRPAPAGPVLALPRLTPASQLPSC
eukprot:357673-Chlamydomonas_euryale.AAC.6